MNGEIINKSKAFLHLIRIKNLAFLLFLQISLYWLAILHSDVKSGAFLSFIFALAIPSFLIGSFGNTINDYLDFDSDLNNQKRSAFKGQISKMVIHQSSTYLGILAIVSIVLSGIITGSWAISSCLMLSLLSLFYYSKRLKCTSIIGNILISFLAGLSIFLPHYLYTTQNEQSNFSNEYEIFIHGFVFFVFIITLIREIVKDLEDIKGDTAQKCNTLAVSKGESFAKNIALALALITIIILMSWAQNFSMIMNGYIMLFSMFPLMLISGRIVKSKDFGQISNDLKILMMASSLLIFIFHFTHQS